MITRQLPETQENASAKMGFTFESDWLVRTLLSCENSMAFHDFPGAKPKFYDFLGFPGPVQTL